MINSYLCAIRVITLKHNNEELRNTNGCYLVTQFSSSPTNRFILSELSFLAKVTKKLLFYTLISKEVVIKATYRQIVTTSFLHTMQVFTSVGAYLAS